MNRRPAIAGGSSPSKVRVKARLTTTDAAPNSRGRRAGGPWIGPVPAALSLDGADRAALDDELLRRFGMRSSALRTLASGADRGGDRYPTERSTSSCATPILHRAGYFAFGQSTISGD